VPGLRILVLARSYPNPELPLLGLWTQRLAHSATAFAQVKVIAPVPYSPPLPPSPRFDYFNRFRRLARARWEGPVEVLHPRILVGPGASLHDIEGLAYVTSAGLAASRLRPRFPFDLIHAHFAYPDGFAACVLGRRYGVPVIITEHVPWVPWMLQAALVRRQATWAALSCAALIPVSSYVRRTIAEVLGSRSPAQEPLGVLVDPDAFKPDDAPRDPGLLLFVGAVRHTKGLDVLIDALARLAVDHPDVRLLVAGEPFYRAYRRDFEAVRERAQTLGLGKRIEFAGPKSPPEIARLMSQSAAVVVPSRAESFGSVLIESLACGTPVVATRSGGPEDIVTDEVGELVPVDDAPALAAALAAVLDEPGRYDPAALRRYALDRFGRDVVADRLRRHYEAALVRA
jgi:glycosyltransferase involved in cell wall biosynthesis